MSDTTNRDGVDTVTDEPTCCDDPNWGTLPERRFQLPGRQVRETYAECTNCGTTEYDLD